MLRLPVRMRVVVVTFPKFRGRGFN
jgi:hypothetical protein